MKRIQVLEKNRTETGAGSIGPMLILIAIILVSSASAGLFLSTGMDLASQSGQTSSQVSDYASTKFDILSVVLVDVELDQDAEELYLVLQLAPGSGPVNLEKTSVTLTTDSAMCELIYTSSLTGEDATHFNCEMASSADGGSGSSGEMLDPNSEFSLASPMMDPETIVQIHVDLETALGDEASAGTLISLSISSSSSSPAYVQFQVPGIIQSYITHVK
ncbi:MAG: hypothetical protein U9R75_01780 [Candidatus Thermoplasmatota archaeon]|nr:hypothetical protein [Candidatus Thermoplasmatota archaeon]